MLTVDIPGHPHYSTMCMAICKESEMLLLGDWIVLGLIALGFLPLLVFVVDRAARHVARKRVNR